ncbi:methyltransferase [Oceanithermus sp.]
MELADYHALRKLPSARGTVYYKPGAAGLEETYRLLSDTVGGRVAKALDLNAGVGLVSLALENLGGEVTAVEERRASCRALKATVAGRSSIKAVCALPWETNRGGFDTVTLVLGAERGNDWVRQQLAAAAHALAEGGTLWLAGSRKAGFERYLRWARDLVGPGETVARRKDLRVAVLRKTKLALRPEPRANVIEAELMGRRLRFFALPGVFSADDVDPASRLLLENLPEDISGAEVLDLGAGYGALSLPLTLAGAEVTLLEQSLAAVESARLSYGAANSSAAILHSDVDEALRENRKFDIVVSNPPFHVGGHVVLDVAEAFVAAAHLRLRPGGRFYLVANPFLKYDSWMQKRFGNVRELYSGSYKVLLSTKS